MKQATDASNLSKKEPPLLADRGFYNASFLAIPLETTGWKLLASTRNYQGRSSHLALNTPVLVWFPTALILI